MRPLWTCVKLSHRVTSIFSHLGIATYKYAASASSCGWLQIRPKCTTTLYCNSPLYIDIFHFMVLFLCCFGLFYIVCNFPVQKQQTQDSAMKSGHQVAEYEDLQI